jgi:hypothetical protein
MAEVTNAVLLSDTLHALYTVAERRTSERFADEVIGSTLKTLEQKYEFLKYVHIPYHKDIEHEFGIEIKPEINAIHPERIAKAIESILRVVYADLSAEAGLFFITELKEYAGKDTILEIVNRNVDLDQLQLEQHHLYMRREKKKFESGATKTNDHDKEDHLHYVNRLGYTWDDVSSWNYNPESQMCTLYTSEGKVLDRLNLDRIIQNYVTRLSGETDVSPAEYEKEVQILEKEYELLKILQSRDMNAETATKLLHITKEDLTAMINKLSRIEMLHFVSYDELELTHRGINYISKKEK